MSRKLLFGVYYLKQFVKHSGMIKRVCSFVLVENGY